MITLPPGRRYIAFEGIDGSGKDTQAAVLADRLDRSGITPILLREPSHGPIGQRIRQNLIGFPSDVAEQRRLFTADRRDHVAQKVAPALTFVRESEGFVIVQNRCIVSAAAYQPMGPDDDGLISTLNAELRTAPLPDLVLVLDVPVAVALQRISASGRPDDFERPAILTAVRDRYRRLTELVDACVLVDADGDRDAIANRVEFALARGR
jgi:dTMP kinase